MQDGLALRQPVNPGCQSDARKRYITILDAKKNIIIRGGENNCLS